VLSELVAERSAILNWLLDGLADWQDDHNWTADEVRAANDAYRAEMDVLGAFVDDCCVLGPRHVVVKSKLYVAYENWCSANGEEPVKKKTFSQRLTARGVADRRGAHGVHQYVGIGLQVTEGDTLSVFSSETPHGENIRNNCHHVSPEGQCEWEGQGDD